MKKNLIEKLKKDKKKTKKKKKDEKKRQKKKTKKKDKKEKTSMHIKGLGLRSMHRLFTTCCILA